MSFAFVIFVSLTNEFNLFLNTWTIELTALASPTPAAFAEAVVSVISVVCVAFVLTFPFVISEFTIYEFILLLITLTMPFAITSAPTPVKPVDIIPPNISIFEAAFVEVKTPFVILTPSI